MPLRRSVPAALVAVGLAASLVAPSDAAAQARTKADTGQQRVDTVPVRPDAPARAAMPPMRDPADTPAADTAITARYRAVAARILAEATKDSTAWNRMAYLSDTFGPRLSGSPHLERALSWLLAEMRRDGFDRVWEEPVMVPAWRRGQESATLTAPYEDPLPMLGLGGSVGTPPEGVEAPVVVVGSFEELDARCAEARGKMVLFDVPFTTYGQTVAIRTNGPREASRCGAVGALIRSVASGSLATPHTGTTRYTAPVGEGGTNTAAAPDVRPIPAAALTVEDAARLHRLADRGVPIRLRLKMEARTLPDAPSRNVLAELRGSERPDEIVVIGGHTDSWDVGTGAMDDGGGVVAAWEAIRVLKALGLRPRRTIRVVGWVNEENGLRGGEAYARMHAAEMPKHVVAIESDGGTFQPTGFGFTGRHEAFAQVAQVGPLLAAIGAGQIVRGGGGADIAPMRPFGVPQMSLNVDGSRYFHYHHTEADSPDKIAPHEIARCAAAFAVMAYVLADLPEPLPRGAQ